MSQSNVIEVISPDGGRKEVPLHKSIVFIGSDPNVDVPLAGSPGIAARHLQLIVVPDARCRLVNLGNSDVFLGETSEKGLAPHSSSEVADGESIKIGNFVLIFRSGGSRAVAASPVGWNASGQSQHIGLSMTLPQTRLAPNRTLEGIVTVSNLGDIAGVQFELELEGFESDYYELEPGPLLSSGAEKEVLFRLYHRGAKPLAGDYNLTIYATAPRAYPAEQGKVSQIIQVLPLYQHKLTLVSPAGAKPAPPPPAVTRPVVVEPSRPVAPEPVGPVVVELPAPVTSEPVQLAAPPPLPSLPAARESVQSVSWEPALPSVSEPVQPAVVESAALPDTSTSDVPLAAPPKPKPSGWWARLFGSRQTPPIVESASLAQAAAPVEAEALPPAEVEIGERPVEAEPPSPVAEEPAEVVDVQPRLLADTEEPARPVPEIEISAPEPTLTEEVSPLAEAAPAVEIKQPEPDEAQELPPAAVLAPVEVPLSAEVEQPEPAETKTPLLIKPKLVSPAAQSDDWWASPIESASRLKEDEQNQKKSEPAPETTQVTEQLSKSKQVSPAETTTTPPAEDWWTTPEAAEQPQRRVLKFKAAPASEPEAAQPAASQAKAEDWWTSQDTQDGEDKIED